MSPAVLVHARCISCGYSLRGLSSCRCPECGQAFDADNPRTMHLGLRSESMHSWLTAAPRWPIHVGVAAATLLTLWGARLPSWERLTMSGAAVCWSILIAWWLVRASLVRRARTTGIELNPRSAMRGWHVLPVALSLLIAALAFDLPARAAFAISRPALQRLAAQTRGRTLYTSPTGWAGVLPVGACLESGAHIVIKLRGDPDHYLEFVPTGVDPTAADHWLDPHWRYGQGNRVQCASGLRRAPLKPPG
jgi:hypothetical protein